MSKRKWNFEWNYSKNAIIKRKGFGRDLNKFMAETFFQHAYKYVPYDSQRVSGIHMADDVTIKADDDSSTITYNAEYTPAQYENEYNHDLTVHPLATDHWADYCWNQEKRSIIGQVDWYRRKHSQ